MILVPIINVIATIQGWLLLKARYFTKWTYGIHLMEYVVEVGGGGELQKWRVFPRVEVDTARRSHLRPI